MRRGGKFGTLAFAVLACLCFFLLTVAPVLSASESSPPTLPATALETHLSETNARVGTLAPQVVIGGSPNLEGGFFADDDRILGFVGYDGFGGTYNVLTNGSQVYAGALVITLYGLFSTGSLDVNIGFIENGQETNDTVIVPASSSTQYTLTLPQITSWTSVELLVGGTALGYSVAVPISFLPSNIADVGGEDLLALAVLSEALITLAGAMAVAYSFMRRALWAPKFSLLIWGHVILITLVGLILGDFQWVDQTFAGWSPLVYCLFLFPVFLVFALSYFNKAPRGMILRANAPRAGRLSYNCWMIRTAIDNQGRLVLIDPTWRGFWARLWGHHVPLVTEEARITQPEPFVADIRNLKVPTRSGILRRVGRPSPEKNLPTDDFLLIPATPDGRPPMFHDNDLPQKLYWTPVGQPVYVEWCHLTIHRDVLVEAETSPEGAVLVPRHHERHLSLPHYTKGEAHLILHTIHYRSAQSVVAGWRSHDDLAQVLSDTSLDLEAVKADFQTNVARKVRERLLAREALLGRGEDDLDEVEAAAEAEREKSTTSPLEELFGRALVEQKNLTPDAPRNVRKREK